MLQKLKVCWIGSLEFHRQENVFVTTPKNITNYIDSKTYAVRILTLTLWFCSNDFS